MPQLGAAPLRPGLAERFSCGLASLSSGARRRCFSPTQLARLADPIFGGAAGAIPPFVDAWHGALTFSFQPFASYSEMAIGLGLMLGVSTFGILAIT